MSGFSYWQDCVAPNDLEAMWKEPEVNAEWLKAGEVRGRKVHLSRDPDGQPYLTQTEMRAVAEIIVARHFPSQIDPSMICAIAEIASDRQLLVMRFTNKSKEATIGLMQLLPKTIHWLISELGYRSYAVDVNDEGLLFHPFTNVYFGAAYIHWLSNFENKERSEEFIVRAYSGGTKKATHRSTLKYWKSYLSAKESFPSRKRMDDSSPLSDVQNPSPSSHDGRSQVPSLGSPKDTTNNRSYYWDSIVSRGDMEAMWNHPEVRQEWIKTNERLGMVRFAHDEKHRPFLSRVELKAVADIILCKYHFMMKFKSTVLCAISEIVCKRFVYGVGARPGIMGIDYSTAYWFYLELGYRAYKLESPKDLCNPFVSMYFGAAYVAWLSEFEGRERSPEFVVQAYCVGPRNVNLGDTNTLWLKFQEAFGKYEDTKNRNRDSCTIM